MDKKYINDENRLLRVKVLKSDEPYLWYAKYIGQEFTVIDHRYNNNYEAIHPDTGYIGKENCEIIKILIRRRVPDFPFKVRILKNSWFPQCWYANRIGETFEVINGCTYGEWKAKLPNGNLGNIVKGDCEIIRPH